MSCNYFCKYPKGRDIVLSFILIKKNKGQKSPGATFASSTRRSIGRCVNLLGDSSLSCTSHGTYWQVRETFLNPLNTVYLNTQSVQHLLLNLVVL